MNSTYFGLPKEYSDYNSSRIVVLPVPLDVTTSYVKGTGMAPKAIFDASLQVEFYDEELEQENYRIGVATLPPLSFGKGSLEDKLKIIETAVEGIVNDKKIPLLLGGEHGITPPAISGLSQKYSSLTVVQFDAHADLRQEYGGTKWSHACAMARVREICPVVQVGIRNLSKEEADWVSREKLPVFFAHEIQNNKEWMSKALAAVKTKDVYVTIDVDAFDSSIMPDTGTPEPGGLNWWEITSFIRDLAKQKRIVGFDICELTPRKDHHASDFIVAKLAYRCIGYWAKFCKDKFSL